jgi:hypothetical protein
LATNKSIVLSEPRKRALLRQKQARERKEGVGSGSRRRSVAVEG